jgi:hypothetical protein
VNQPPSPIDRDMDKVAGPDFICIGMQKAGTDWLYDQLQFHPDFWMPPVKEFHYFDKKEPRIGRAKKFLEMGPRRLKNRLSRRRPWDERDQLFLEEASRLEGALDIQRYAALFRHKGDLLSGEITPGYSTLGEDIIARMGEELPGTKIVLLVRDPIARAWSQISMAHRHDNFDASVLDDPGSFANFLRNSALVGDRSFPTHIFERWSRCAPNLSLRAFLFDEIVGDAERAREMILDHLGADPAKKSGVLPSDHNRKSQLPKLPLSEENLAVLIDHFRDELHAAATLFGGAAQSWPGQYGL